MGVAADIGRGPIQPGPAGIPMNSEAARQLLKALADPIRLGIIEALGSGERCVCDLTGELDLAQSRLSFHLKVMGI